MAFDDQSEKILRMNKDQLYRQLKAEWLCANPGATAEQIEAECKRIAERLGV